MARAGNTGSVVSLPAGRNAASGLHGASVARRRDGARKNDSGDRRLLLAAPSRKGFARAGGDAGIAQDRVGGTDPEVYRSSLSRGLRPPPQTSAHLWRFGVLYDRQL